ncbi:MULTISPECIES: helix-turn-helix domain-containing protein [unclassified Arcicella]|uniref:helix-turn-helix domain-containing protein n=1 Tax=unclassified Arcicella TaxID=2644986 RepID=UPI0028564269|nr:MULTISPECIES: helix-turn-helix domain-containing protein [unclassified Arcicella]MDR6561093.1 AraC-like DNA-binding protein [Arcicella sp. BE51]MDR6810977.1 AraC-like DNA-binding protein [Arcicella sp. BE140]MDR6822327.1 AraC-like DNA-binding protein [Arcicella sp. BE139]
MLFNWIGFGSVLFLLGLAIFFLRNRHNNAESNLYLGLLFLLQAVSNLHFFAFRLSDIINHIPYFIHFSAGFRFLWGVLLYFFVQTYTGKTIKYQGTTYLHFVPAIVATIFFYGKLFFIPSNEIHQYVALIKLDKHPVNRPYHLLLYLSNVAYLVASLVAVLKYRLALTTYFSNIEKLRLVWLFNILLFLMIFHFVLPLGYGLISIKFFPYVPLMQLPILSFVAWKAYAHPELFTTLETFSEEIHQKGIPKLDETKVVVAMPTLDDSFINTLLQFMEVNKPYLNPELTIKILSDDLGIPSYQLSKILNQHFQKNFFDFVNTYRVEEAKKKLITPEYTHLTLEGIGYECGFNSKSSFYAVFKKYANQTPAEYRKERLV